MCYYKKLLVALFLFSFINIIVIMHVDIKYIYVHKKYTSRNTKTTYNLNALNSY
jgi:hypothetical protein